MTIEQQQSLYTKIFATMLEQADLFLTLPLSVERLCDALGIDLYPLSELTERAKVSERDLLQAWGNEDGVVMEYNGRAKIAYNDGKPYQRQRFTICEEVSHYILGHTKDPRFNAFNQSYDLSTYRKYEEEARTGAGLYLCPPQFFYEYPSFFNEQDISFYCDVSGDCARTRFDTLKRFEPVIKSNELFDYLPVALTFAGREQSKIQPIVKSRA